MHKRNSSFQAEQLESRRHLSVTLASGTLLIQGTNAVDSVVVNTSGSTTTVSDNSVYYSYPTSSISNIWVFTYGGNDTIYITSNVFKPTTLGGGTGDDYIAGGSAADSIHGDAGRDSIYGSGGNDSIYGDADRDFVYGNGGNDYLNGGDEIDGIYGGDGNDGLVGGWGSDSLYGEGGNDLIIGVGGNDFAYDGYGSDTVYGDSYGGITFIATPTPDGGDHYYSGGASPARVTYEARTSGVNVSVDDVANDGAPGEGDNVHSGVLVRGTEYADVITGATVTHGLGGNDLIVVNSAGGSAHGGQGNDYIIGSDAADYLAGDEGNDSIFGNGGDDELVAGSFSGFGDVLDTGNDLLDGGTGNDDFYIGYGADSVYGASGYDTLYFLFDGVGGDTTDSIEEYQLV
jgi:Ca2+-binding RTX toxin-like protein